MLLLDGDIIAWRTGTTKYSNIEDYYRHCDIMIGRIKNSLSVFDRTIYISGKTYPVFRVLLDPNYKANRKDLIKPKEVSLIEQYLKDCYNTVVIDHYEADDALGWNQTEDTIICTLDKDLDMIPGKHYNFKTKNLYSITPQQGLTFFYRQMLIGDRIDNVTGIYGIGPKKAEKILPDLLTEQEMFDTVYDLYTKHNIQDSFLMNGICLWILRNEEETWAHRLLDLTLPNPLQQQVEAALNSMKYLWDT
jgi:5'-3' exonuclease